METCLGSCAEVSSFCYSFRSVQNPDAHSNFFSATSSERWGGGECVCVWVCVCLHLNAPGFFLCFSRLHLLVVGHLRSASYGLKSTSKALGPVHTFFNRTSKVKLTFIFRLRNNKVSDLEF